MEYYKKYVMLIMLLFATATNAFAVTATKGRFVGIVDGHSIDAGLTWETDESSPYISIETDKAENKAKNEAEIQVVGLKQGSLAAIITVNGKTYKFGGFEFDKNGRILSYSDSFKKSKKQGPYKVNFTLKCEG